jgi:hypothetical protein
MKVTISCCSSNWFDQSCQQGLHSTPKLAFTVIDQTETSTVLSTDNIALTSSGSLQQGMGSGIHPDIVMRIENDSGGVAMRHSKPGANEPRM